MQFDRVLEIRSPVVTDFNAAQPQRLQAAQGPEEAEKEIQATSKAISAALAVVENRGLLHFALALLTGVGAAWHTCFYIPDRFITLKNWAWTPCLDEGNCRLALGISLVLTITTFVSLVFVRIAISSMLQACRRPATLVLRRAADEQSQALKGLGARWLFKKDEQLQAAHQAAQQSHQALLKAAVAALKRSPNRAATVNAIANFTVGAKRANAEYTAKVAGSKANQ